MNIELTSGKDVVLPEMVKDRIEQKLAKVESRLSQRLFVRVRFNKVSAENYSCQIHFNGGRTEFNASANADDLVKAMDKSVAKIERQLNKVQHKQSNRDRQTIRDTIDRDLELDHDLDL
jgi:ribosomal subunit interface protein